MPKALEWTRQADERLLEMRATGLPWHAVADKLGVGRSAAIKRARRLELEPRTRVQPAPVVQAPRVDRPALAPFHPVARDILRSLTPSVELPTCHPWIASA